MIHTITAHWLDAKTGWGNPRVMIKRKYVWVWDKNEDRLEKYPFLGKSQKQWAFKIQCIGKHCTWSHRQEELVHQHDSN